MNGGRSACPETTPANRSGRAFNQDERRSLKIDGRQRRAVGAEAQTGDVWGNGMTRQQFPVFVRPINVSFQLGSETAATNSASA